MNLTTRYTYDGFGNRVSATDPRGNTTTYNFDALGHMTKMTPPAGVPDSAVSFTYDADGRPTGTQRVVGSLTQTTSTTYLPTGQVRLSTDTSGDTTTFGYAPASRYDVAVDGANTTTYTFYDANGRVSSVNKGNVYIDVRAYTPNGLLAQRNDGNSNATFYRQDGFDRLAALVYADGTSEQFAYTVDDDLDYKGTRAGQPVRWSFDALHRITSRTGDPNVSYGYDYDGRLLSAATPVVAGDPSSGLWQRVYDAAGRRIADGAPDGRASGYAYDRAGNRGILALQNASGPSSTVWFNSTFDALNRLSSVLNCETSNTCQPAGGTPTLWADYYDVFGRLTTRGYGPGITSTYAYLGTGSDLGTITHNYAGGGSIALTYAYNNAHQVTSSTTAASLLHPAASGSSGLGTPNTVNELPGPASQFTYDANGNLTGDGQATYVYDQEGDGRVVSATLPGGVAVTYRYDPFGRRYSKSVNGTTTVYLHDEQDREVAEYDGASGGVLQYDVYGAGGTVPVARVAADNVTASYLDLDRLGSVVAVAGSGGALSSQGSYLPFGQGAGPNAGPPPGAGFGYAGYRWDDESGLYHTRARYYDPRKGRFLQPDPIRQNGGLNLYAYVENDPLNLTDPSGMLPGQIGSATYSQLVEVADGVKRLGDDFIDNPSDTLRRLAPSLGGLGAVAGELPQAVSGAITAIRLLNFAPPSPVQFAQQGISSTFRNGEFAGQSVRDVANGVRSGIISPDRLPLNVITRDSVTYTLNNRSLMALRLGGREPTILNDVAGNSMFEGQLTQRLNEIGSNAGPSFTPLIRGN